MHIAPSFCWVNLDPNAPDKKKRRRGREETRRKYDDCGFDEDNITTTEAGLGQNFFQLKLFA